MAQKKSSDKGNSGLVAAEIGAGVLAAAAAGAGYYFYAAKDAGKHRRKASKWADDMKKDVIKQAKTVQKLDKKAMAAIVDRTAKTYAGMKNASREDVLRAASELKSNWDKVQVELAKAAKKGGSTAKKAAKSVKKAVKKTTKKVATSAKKAVKKATKKAVPKKASKNAKKKR